MKKFKQIDFIISMTLMTSFVLLAFIRRDGSIMLGYFVVGGWQVASMIVHEIKKWFVPAGRRRRVYPVSYTHLDVYKRQGFIRKS